MKNVLKAFEIEFEKYAQDFGESKATRTLSVLTKALYWVRKYGHGNLILSAVNNCFGLKIRAETVYSVKDN